MHFNIVHFFICSFYSLPLKLTSSTAGSRWNCKTRFVFACYQSNLNIISTLRSFMEDFCLHLIGNCFLFYVSFLFMNIYMYQKFFEKLLFHSLFLCIEEKFIKTRFYVHYKQRCKIKKYLKVVLLRTS